MSEPAATASGFDYTQGVDYPVRVEVPMPRDLFDRLTRHDDAPICRYEDATGLAEFVAMPTLSHESRAALATRLFAHIEFMMVEAGNDPGFLHALSVRVLSDDGAFEPDASLFVEPSRAVMAADVEGYLDTRLGHPVPDLVVEVDRAVHSRRKLLPYFRMGIREAWTWSPRDGVRIWAPDPPRSDGITMVERSTVLPGVGLEALDRLLGDSTREERLEVSRQLARQVAEAWRR